MVFKSINGLVQTARFSLATDQLLSKEKQNPPPALHVVQRDDGLWSSGGHGDSAGPFSSRRDAEAVAASDDPDTGDLPKTKPPDGKREGSISSQVNSGHRLYTNSELSSIAQNPTTAPAR
jgi:hypothetical protein